MSDNRKIVNSRERAEEMVAEVRRLFNKHGYVEFRWDTERQRTLTQNRALHLWFRLLAETLNDAGLDMRQVIREEVEIPWTESAVKEYLWRPVQKAMLQKQSTTEANRTDYTEVRDVIARHLGQRFGVEVPEWPSVEREEA